MDLSGLRLSYEQGELSEGADDPVVLFDAWFAEAAAAGGFEPNAMTLATADTAGRPSARTVLLKASDERGLVWYTNFDSRKGRELAANPQAALLFGWLTLERQVRVEGTVERVSDLEADTYFVSRPLGSRLGAWASPQSEVVADRAELDRRLAAATEEFGDHPPRPPWWGGYRLIPHVWEFWQGRGARMHDRLRFTRTATGWTRERLAP